jgi:tetratricopeptide (TPR) repeat protein
MRAVTAVGVLLLIGGGMPAWVAPSIGRGDAAISFGWATMALGGIGGIGWWSRSTGVLAVCGVMGLGLASLALLYLAFIDPALWALIDENAQYAQIMHFSRTHLPANFGIEPTFQGHLAIDTIQDRLATAVYFMGPGWWLCAGASMLVLVGCFPMAGRRLMQWLAIAALLMFGAHGALLYHGVVAHYRQERGDRHMASGHYREAIQRYEAAQRLAPQVAQSEWTHLRIGEAYYHLGIISHQHGRFYLGDRYAQQGDVAAALAEYLSVAQEAAGPLQTVVRKRIAWTYIQMGSTQYRHGEVGPAVGRWEKALAFDPTQIQAAYFLCRAYFDQGRYHQSIDLGQALLPRIHNQLLKANIQANLGDSYWKLNDFKRARQAYEASMRLDSLTNYRIFKSLGGT